MFGRCDNPDCCGKPTLPQDKFLEIRANGLTFPEPDPRRPGHFQTFEATYGRVTTEKHLLLVSGASNLQNAS